MRRAIVVALITAVHYIATLAAMLRNLGSVMRDFDSGGQAQVTVADFAFALLQTVLYFPLLAPLGDLWPTALRTGPFPLQHVPLIANSLLWAFALVAVFRLGRRRVEQ